MKRIAAYTACIAAILGTALMPVSVTAQEKSLKDQLVGTWVYDSSTITRADGTKSDRPNLKGMVIYTPEGRFMFINVGTDTPRIASNDRARATPEEAMSVLNKTIAYYGTYTIDEPSKTIVPKVEGSTFARAWTHKRGAKSEWLRA